MRDTPLAGLMAALRFDAPRLPRWSEAEWRQALPTADRAQLTLPLAERWRNSLPAAIRERLDRDLANTTARQGHLRDAYIEIAAALSSPALPFTVLKGFAGDGVFFPCAFHRAQYDLDLLLQPAAVNQARDVLVNLGYQPLGEPGELPTDHLPVMVRKTGWEWRGDFFDPDIPVSVDLHFRLWDMASERFPAPGWEQFFDRRTVRTWAGLAFPALTEADALAYHCLHLLRHLLRGSLRVAHVHELAYFLHTHSSRSGALWDHWKETDPQLRRLQAICFALARNWFGPSLAPAARQEIDSLSPGILDWLRRYGDSPLRGIEQPNKDELWLHLSLLENWRDRRAVLRRRLLPGKIPRFADTAYLPESGITPARRWLSRFRRLRFVAVRVWHHARALPGVAAHGSRWLWIHSETGSLSSGYWQFLGAATVFNLGSFIFLVLYNLYLADLGLREDVLGSIASAMTAGSLLGSIPGGMFLRRYGARSALTLCFAALAAFSFCRVLFVSFPALVTFAFCSGLAFSLFAVAVAPTIAQLAGERARARAFSLFFAIGIALGIAGGQLAGHLPAWLGSKRAALLLACALIGSAALPALGLSIKAQPPSGEKIYPRGPFVNRFLAAVLIWSAAAGAFSPFFNVFFAQRMQATVPQVGDIYSLAQLAQVAAIMAAPHLIAHRGARHGVALSQLLCGIALAALAVSSQVGLGAAALFYAAYLGFHFMGEPGLFSLLMNHSRHDQRSGASALNFLATFAGQAIAVAAAGIVATRYGYMPVLLASAGLSWAAAAIVWRLPASEPGQ